MIRHFIYGGLLRNSKTRLIRYKDKSEGSNIIMYKIMKKNWWFKGFIQSDKFHTLISKTYFIIPRLYFIICFTILIHIFHLKSISDDLKAIIYHIKSNFNYISSCSYFSIFNISCVYSITLRDWIWSLQVHI